MACMDGGETVAEKTVTTKPFWDRCLTHKGFIVFAVLFLAIGFFVGYKHGRLHPFIFGEGIPEGTYVISSPITQFKMVPLRTCGGESCEGKPDDTKFIERAAQAAK